jgi:hypothetical protein
MRFIFRDDDTSFFTRPAMLERVYARLWARQIPVSLAVIPNHHGKIVIHDTLDPNVPPAHRGEEAYFPITQNPDLCAWLRDKTQAGLVEICQHGYTHDFMECVTDNGPAFGQQIAAGKQLLEAVLPGRTIQTYLPPYGCVSETGLSVLLETGMTIMVSRTNWPPIQALADLPPYTCTVFNNVRCLVDGAFAGDPLDDPAGWLANAQAQAGDEAVLVHVNHYWQFYHDFGEPDPAAFARWDRFLDVVLAHPDLVFTSFSGDARG